MTASRPSPARRTGAVRILSLLVLSGCAAETPVSGPVQEPNFAKGGGSGPTVRAADPDSGLRNTTIDVRVLGSGFDNGSKATWALAGDTANATTKVTTNSTRFVKSGELVANITIAADAPLALFDVVVITLAGKKGIGIEKFTVKATGQYTALFDDATGYLLRSDNGTAYVDGGPDFETGCVGSNEFPGGIYQLRTIANAGICKAVQRPGWRWFTFDLGPANTFDLDQDGTAEPVENAPARLGFQEAFAHGATSTPVRILILVVNPDGSTTQNSQWSVAYPQGAVTTPTASGGRVLTTVSGTADIYFPVLVGRKMVSTKMGTVQLPFKLTLTPQP